MKGVGGGNQLNLFTVEEGTCESSGLVSVSGVCVGDGISPPCSHMETMDLLF